METIELKEVGILLPNTLYRELMEIYTEKKAMIGKNINDGGKIRKEIVHGDYGYILLNGIKKIRLFFLTDRKKIEAFCTEHHLCSMGFDVNKDSSAYFICGNLLN